MRESNHLPGGVSSAFNSKKRFVRGAETGDPSSSPWTLLLFRFAFVALSIAAAARFRPFYLRLWPGMALGLVVGVAIILIELRIRRESLARLIGASIGALVGLFAASILMLLLAQTSLAHNSESFLSTIVFLLCLYTGVLVGADKGSMLNLHAFGTLFESEPSAGAQIPKILDTSVIIDGRLADVIDAQFLDGVVLVPQFVLHELQVIADAPDPLKRQRGRRGLEILERIRRAPQIEVRISTENFDRIPEVDLKLIELAQLHGAKLVTNDFNLNKVATLQGLPVLNINALAKALKPVVLPGEVMRIFIQREGKEYNQGVGYLEDGTMVVVDGARRLINHTLEIVVTSVHQTTAGKMIFARYDERLDAPRPATAAAAASGSLPGEHRSNPAPASSERIPSAVYHGADRE